MRLTLVNFRTASGKVPGPRVESTVDRKSSAIDISKVHTSFGSLQVYQIGPLLHSYEIRTQHNLCCSN